MPMSVISDRENQEVLGLELDPLLFHHVRAREEDAEIVV